MRKDSASDYGQAEDKIVKTFVGLSHQAFGIYSAGMSTVEHTVPVNRLHALFGYAEESTSEAMRILITSGNTFPAVALARVRVEQLIVISYLIHEDFEKALLPYLQQHPIDRYKAGKEAIKDPLLKTFLSSQSHQHLAQVAAAAHQARDPSSDGTEKSLNQSKWTKLDLLSMAKRRDTLTKEKTDICAHPLETSYQAFYRDFSSVIHSGSIALMPDFTVSEILPDGKHVIFPNPAWTRLLAMTLAYWDILGMYEILQRLAIDKKDAFRHLHNEWFLAKSDYFGIDASDP